MNIINDFNSFKKNIVHLHVHTSYSQLDGSNSIVDCIKRAKELDMNAIAITDHNHLGGILDFQKECKKNNIKPIIGCEMYQTWDTSILSLDADSRREYAINLAMQNNITIPDTIDGRRISKRQIDELLEDYTYDTKQYHLIVLAKNQKGYDNLIKLQSEAASLCTYNGRFCCDFNLLEKYSEGLIILSACLGGMIPSEINKGNIAKAEELVLRYKKIFKDDFYLEIQPLNNNEQKNVNLELLRIANKYDIQLVATNDVHYTYKEDYDDHDTLLCIGIGRYKDDEDRIRYDHEFWIRSYNEMLEAFSRHEKFPIVAVAQAIQNTLLIADKIEDNIKIGSDKPILPSANIPKGLTSEQYFTMESYKGLYKYYNKNKDIDIKKYEKRLAEELNTINPKGYAPYMLIVKDIFDYCKQEKIPTGPGRGSASGSLALFVNDITKVIDPIKYDLLFFRFLTKDRVDLPDIDSDFSYYNRHKIIKYLEDKYGKECVSHIGTYSEIGVKSGLKDFGRVLRIPFDVMNNITKTIDEIMDYTPSIKFKDLDELEELARDEKNEAMKQKYQDKSNTFKSMESQYSELFRLARKFEGTPRNMGTHASGILVTPVPVHNLVPTRIDKDGAIVTLFTGPQLEECNLVKIDILGLKTLDVLDKSVKKIDANATVDDLYELIKQYLDNKEMFAMIQRKETEGIFQVESNLFKKLMDDIMPTDINDIIALLSIGRPGPLSAGMHTAYGNRKNGFEDAIPQLPGTEDITKDTFHTILYQEQLMLISKRVAGFNDSQSDSILRKAVAKKKRDKMDLCRQLFIYGKINSDFPEDYDINNKNQPYYDPKGELGDPILGGINNGYDILDLEEFWSKMEGYASYLFNRSHSAAYSVLTLCTMFLKKFHTSKFLASLMSMQDDQEKIDLYSKIARNYQIEVLTPDINLSSYDFDEVNNKIMYGLRSIKGVGINSINEIIEKRPFNNIEECIEKIDKKLFNKRVGAALIKAGAFDFYNDNRFNLLNRFMDIRKDKDDRYISESYNEDACIEFEKEVLGTPITYIPFWDNVKEGEVITCEVKLINTTERKDKNGNMMAFVDVNIGNSKVKCLVFSSLYSKNVQTFDKHRTEYITLKGKKDKDSLIVSSVISKKEKTINNESYNYNDFVM